MNQKVNLDQLSKLANLPISSSQKKTLNQEIDSFLTYVDQIQKLMLEDVEPTNQVTHKSNELRQDIITPGLTQLQALSQAKNTHKGYFVVPAVFKDLT